MTLKKYIKRLADKLDRMKQFDRAKAAENARKARANCPIPSPSVYPSSRFISVQQRRYGFCHWASWLNRRGRGVKNKKGQLLPRTLQ